MFRLNTFLSLFLLVGFAVVSLSAQAGQPKWTALKFETLSNKFSSTLVNEDL